MVLERVQESEADFAAAYGAHDPAHAVERERRRQLWVLGVAVEGRVTFGTRGLDDARVEVDDEHAMARAPQGAEQGAAEAPGAAAR